MDFSRSVVHVFDFETKDRVITNILRVYERPYSNGEVVAEAES